MLRDPYGRGVTNLRISLTQRCNLSCIYCHREGERGTAREVAGEMATDEIAGIMKVAGELGIRRVKFTGGEPTLREDLCEIVSSVPVGMESSMTTNGTLLADLAHELKDSGLGRVNISLDTLDRERYRDITRRDLLVNVLEGVEAALDARLTPVKLNMVLLKGINEDEVDSFIAFVGSRKQLILQLIELLPSEECGMHAELRGVEEQLRSRADEVRTREMQHRRKYYMNGAEIEVVRPLHNTEFCAYCNRLRVTSDGKLKPCLLRSDNHVDIRGVKGEELRERFMEAVRRRAPFFA